MTSAVLGSESTQCSNHCWFVHFIRQEKQTNKQKTTENSIVKENESSDLDFNITQYKINSMILGVGWQEVGSISTC